MKRMVAKRVSELEPGDMITVGVYQAVIVESLTSIGSGEYKIECVGESPMVEKGDKMILDVLEEV